MYRETSPTLASPPSLLFSNADVVGLTKYGCWDKTINDREVYSAKSVERRAFVMRIDEIEDVEEVYKEEAQVVAGRRSTSDFYVSDGDDSELELPCRAPYALMDTVGLGEGALLELTHEHQLSVTEVVRNQVLALETDLMDENNKFIYGLDRVTKYAEAQQEIDRKQDMQYQHQIAEALDNHLTEIWREHERKSHAAIEEARRREKALLEEKLRQKMAEKKRAEEAKAAAVEADRKSAKEAAESQTGNILKCAESARKLEERRQQIYKEVAMKNEEWRLGSNTDPLNHGAKIWRLVRTITGVKDNVRTKSDQLVEIFFDSSCPQSISVAIFADKIVEQCLTPNKAVFAYALATVLVSSRVPLAMDLLLAQLNRACIYTVPKHITYSKALFGMKEAYCLAIGYKEDDGEVESEEKYVQRVDSCMRLYGALVQTEDGGVENKNGLTAGWAWLARFLNALPANLYTGVALLAFLEMAGFALYRRYKGQFEKILNIIYQHFLSALKQRREGDGKIKRVITSLESYIELNKFLEEPECRSLRSSLLSRDCC